VLICGNGARGYSARSRGGRAIYEAPIITKFKAKGLVPATNPCMGVLGRSGIPVRVHTHGSQRCLLVLASRYLTTPASPVLPTSKSIRQHDARTSSSRGRAWGRARAHARAAPGALSSAGIPSSGVDREAIVSVAGQRSTCAPRWWTVGPDALAAQVFEQLSEVVRGRGDRGRCQPTTPTRSDGNSRRDAGSRC